MKSGVTLCQKSSIKSQTIMISRKKALAKIIQDELISQLPSSTKELTFMDYGGGTGLVSLALADRFKQLLLVDSSDAMLTIAEDKIKTSGLTNVSSATFDATTESIDQKNRSKSRSYFDVISPTAYS